MNAPSWLAILLLTAAAVSLGDKRLRPLILTYAVQSLLLGSVVITDGWQRRSPAVIAYGVAIIGIKGLATPAYITWMSRRLGVQRELEPILNIPLSLLAAGLSLLATLRVASTIHLPDATESILLVTGLGTVLLGLLTMATRRRAVTQSLGLLTMENGAFLVSLTLAGGLPLAIELSAFLEVIVLVVLLGILFQRIHQSFESIDASAMTTLGE